MNLREILENHKKWLDGEKDGTRANLYGADLYGADLTGADLRGADLRGADLTDANLTRANLTRADLYGADLRGADLRGADLYGADLTDVKLKIIHIKGSRHAIDAIDGDVRVGCKRMPIAEWLENFGKVGAIEGYTEDQIAEYGIYLRAIADVLALTKGGKG